MNKALFIDLDSTLIFTLSGRTFPLHSEDWTLNLQLVPLLKKAVGQGYKILIVTNQGGISQGYLTDFAFNRKMELILKVLEKELKVKKNTINFSYCSEYPEDYRRKPQPGMAYELALDYDLDLKNSIMIGDMPTDKQFKENAGIGYYFDVTEVNEDII